MTQKAAFNSPVWFNIGVRVPQQASACFILHVDDTMDSILNWYVEEGMIFKGGSGAGINLSGIRSSVELLQGGGTASGPVSSCAGADASAGTIKSGGKTRRAAKMVILDVDHPDIEEFIWCKSREEQQGRVLAAAGFDMDLDGTDSHSTQYQNANNSVRVTDEFMRRCRRRRLGPAGRHDGEVVKTVRPRPHAPDRQAPGSAPIRACSSTTTINRWHTCPTPGASTPPTRARSTCPRQLGLQPGQLNLLKFLDEDDNFDVEGFRPRSRSCSPPRRSSSATQRLPDRARSPRPPARSASSASATPTSARCSWPSAALRLRRGPGRRRAITALMTGHAYATVGGAAGRPDGSVRRLRREREPMRA